MYAVKSYANREILSTLPDSFSPAADGYGDTPSSNEDGGKMENSGNSNGKELQQVNGALVFLTNVDAAPAGFPRVCATSVCLSHGEDDWRTLFY